MSDQPLMESFFPSPLETRLEVQKLDSLPAMSFVVGQFLDACADRDVAIDSLAHIIDKDPSLLARIIGVANSAFYSPPEPIATAEEAIFQVLGVDMAKNLALGIVLSGPFNAEKCPEFPLGAFWLESIVTATLAHDLAPLVKAGQEVSAGDAYLAGLLHAFGLLILVHLFPEGMSKIIGRSRGCCSSMDLIADERDVLQTDHLEVGAWLGRKWHLPETIVLVMENYLNTSYQGQARSLVLLINYCTRWASAVLSGSGEKAPPQTNELASLGIDEAHAEEVLNRVIQQLDELRGLARELAGK